MTDDEILAGILRRWVNITGEAWWGENVLMIDGSMDITDEEQAALARAWIVRVWNEK